MKEETLIPYDTSTGDGTPPECISCHDKYKKINNIMTKSEIPKFKNALTTDKHNFPQEQILLLLEMVVTSILLIGMALYFDILNINLIRIERSMLKNFLLFMNGPLKVGKISDSEECIVLIFILLWFHLIIWFRKIDVYKGNYG